MKYLFWTVSAICVLTLLTLQACKHPLAIVGKGDIVDVDGSEHGCTLEQFNAQHVACIENEVTDRYFVNYKAVPRAGWRFVRWGGPCSPRSDFQHCSFEASKALVVWWDETFPELKIPASTAVFEQISGETGYLVAGSAVAGVAFETPSRKGVTGLDGSFEYEEGERVRFMIGDTLLGEVEGQQLVTPFDLADSAVVTGLYIEWAFEEGRWSRGPAEGSPYPDNLIDDSLMGQVGPFHTVINITVLLHSLDHDANPGNGISIRPAVADLLGGVRLHVKSDWSSAVAGGVHSGDLNGLSHSKEWEKFRDNLALRHAVWNANKRRLFSEPHGIANPAHAMQSLYVGLEIDPRTFAKVEERQSNDGDVNVSRYQYDFGGNLIRLQEGNDGLVERVQNYEYDSRDNPISLHVESATPLLGDSQVITWQHRENGLPPRVNADWEGDGVIDHIENWRHDSGELMTKIVTPAHSQEDGQITRYFFKGGNLTCVVLDGVNGNGEECHESYEYDSRGNLLRFRGGHPWSMTVIEYDTDDNPTRATTSSPGEATLIRNRRYDDHGNVIYGDTDEDGDGNPNFINHYQYDADQNLIGVEHWEDDDDDGTANLNQTYALSYDADGNLIRIDWDRKPGIERELYYYYSDGRLARVEYSGNLAPGVIEITSYDYDASGNLIQVEEGTSIGEMRVREAWQYSADGNTVQYQAYGDDRSSPILAREYEASQWGHYFFSGYIPGRPEPFL
jgi:hypothetical protein